MQINRQALDTNGYFRVKLHGRCYFAHRIIFAIMTDKWPDQQIDHINGERCDNRWCNLREANFSENQQNTKLRRNSSGYMGVIWHKRDNKWQAQIMIENKFIWLGYFATPELAYAAYLDAKAQYHIFQPVPRMENAREQNTLDFSAQDFY
jgi:hypothetical protein